MEGRELPGFYYDAEKKKYFRIQETKNALPQAEYSQDNVKLKKRRAEREDADRKHKARQAVQQVQRAPILASGSLPGSILAREASRRLSPGFLIQDRAKLYASLLSPSYSASNDPAHGVPLSVAYDAEDDFVFCFRANITDGNVYFHPAADYPGTTEVHVSNRLATFPMGVNGFISHLSTHPKGMILGTFSGIDEHWVCVFRLGTSLSMHVAVVVSLQQLDLEPTCSASNPYDADSGALAAFAVGMESKVMLLSIHTADVIGVHAFGSQVLSMDWLDAQIVAIGCRDGHVHLWDTRGEGPDYTSIRLKCPGAVRNLHVVNKTYIALQREPQVPALYDLRTASPRNSWPVVKYYGTIQWDMHQGFDVHTGLALAVQADVEGCVLFHNLWTGELLHRIPIANTGRIPYLKFIDTPRGVELLGARGGVDFKLHVRR